MWCSGNFLASFTAVSFLMDVYDKLSFWVSGQHMICNSTVVSMLKLLHSPALLWEQIGEKLPLPVCSIITNFID